MQELFLAGLGKSGVRSQESGVRTQNDKSSDDIRRVDGLVERTRWCLLFIVCRGRIQKWGQYGDVSESKAVLLTACLQFGCNQ